MSAETVARIREILAAKFDIHALEIHDDSALHAGHAGAREGRHYTVRLTSPRFAGLARVARHRLVYDSLGALAPQGVFGAGLSPLSQAIMSDAYPPEERGKAMAIWGMGVMVGPVLGPTLGGWLTDVASWRWAFYINVPVGILSLVLAARFVPDTARNTARSPAPATSPMSSGPRRSTPRWLRSSARWRRRPPSRYFSRSNPSPQISASR